MIDQTTEGGKLLQAVVKKELRQYLGQDYNDDVLPLYIVVMLAHGNQMPLVKDNLEAFLGHEKASVFAEWLFDHLNDNLEMYDPSAANTSPVPEPEQAPEALVNDQDSGQKRPREKREKIEWKGDKQKEVEIHDEKRRRSGDRTERSSRSLQESSPRRDRESERDRYRDQDRVRGSDRDRDWDRGRNRDWNRGRDWDRPRRRSPDRWADEPRPRQSDRYGRPERDTNGFRSDRSGRYDAGPNIANERWTERRNRRYSESLSPERRVPPRLAGRIGRADRDGDEMTRSRRSASSTPPRSPRASGKQSVFDRLQKPANENRSIDDRRQANGPDAAAKARLRMDTIPSSKAADLSPQSSASAYDSDEPEIVPSPVAQQPVTSPVDGGKEEVASELRQIREQLARLNAERAEKHNMEMANQYARKAVVQNVHFNTTPEILKAHFSGCGNIMSAMIEKEATGRPKGVALIEFDKEEARRVALTLSGSLMLGRPITVLAKEPPKQRPGSNFYPPAMPTAFRPRAPFFQRGRGRGPYPGRHTLKNNKYVRPSEAGSNPTAADGITTKSTS